MEEEDVEVHLPASGLRRKEVRLARVADLDTERWRILVAHPKGEGSWAADFAYVAPSARQPVLDYSAERRDYLGRVECEALIPLKHNDGRYGYRSDAYFGKLKAKLEREA